MSQRSRFVKKVGERNNFSSAHLFLGIFGGFLPQFDKFAGIVNWSEPLWQQPSVVYADEIRPSTEN